MHISSSHIKADEKRMTEVVEGVMTFEGSLAAANVTCRQIY